MTSAMGWLCLMASISVRCNMRTSNPSGSDRSGGRCQERLWESLEKAGRSPPVDATAASALAAPAQKEPLARPRYRDVGDAQLFLQPGFGGRAGAPIRSVWREERPRVREQPFFHPDEEDYPPLVALSAVDRREQDPVPIVRPFRRSFAELELGQPRSKVLIGPLRERAQNREIRQPDGTVALPADPLPIAGPVQGEVEQRSCLEARAPPVQLADERRQPCSARLRRSPIATRERWQRFSGRRLLAEDLRDPP